MIVEVPTDDGLFATGMFASPSVAAILAAIRACTVRGAPGCLLIVKVCVLPSCVMTPSKSSGERSPVPSQNYTGDRLNFGVALVKAQAEGLNVEMVVVADDCALPRNKGITGRRGVAGTIFVRICWS